MLLDRFFALVSAATVVLGVACQAAWLTGVAEPRWRDEATIAFFAGATVSLAYTVLYVGKRDRLAYGTSGELEMWSLLRALPAWARMVAIGLLIYGAGLFAVALLPAIAAQPTQACANDPSGCVSWNPFVAAMIAIFMALSFIDAAYLLRTARRSN